MSKLDELHDEVREAVLQAIDGVLAARFGRGALVKDEDLPRLFRALTEVSETCMRRVYFDLPQMLDVSEDVMALNRAELDQRLIGLRLFTAGEIELIRHIAAHGASSHDEDMDAARCKAMLDLLDRDLLGMDENGTLSLKPGCTSVILPIPVAEPQVA